MKDVIEYQTQRIKALEERNNYLENKLKEAKELLNEIALEVEVVEPVIIK